FWGPYQTIAQEHGRTITTFTLFDENLGFHQESFREKVAELGETQEKVVILLNTPANNPTGFSVSDTEWDGIVSTLTHEAEKGHTITLFVDAAYLDYAGDPSEVRQFLKKLDGLSARILVIVGYSMSKGYTLYGMRGGAMIGLSSSEEIAEEFKKVCEQSCRGTWSNCTRAAQALISKVHENPELLKKVEEERAGFREMLLERGRAFEKGANECGLKIIPYDGGFFASIPCDQPEKVVDELMKEGIFLVPLSKGIRVAVSALSLERLVMIPERIRAAMEKCQ
ncbi:MAG: aminotransferase class I/II-fold pyridoxal phosphate-dependent enzyme, partial [Alphaproteobacteria bacterium]|nr:aminotransferase class I/II-fold pyridoxal phosphate-dependent enzyme [Alphaproteobacteria bacterium]